MNEWLTVRIAQKQREATDIVSFKLVDPTGGALPGFTAGAHIDVEVASGLTRQYSICNKPGDDYYMIAVLLEPASRGGSIAMQSLVEGTLIRISKPKNHFALTPDATRTLLFAGGIGVTPLLSMAEHLSRHHAEFHLHYCARSRDRMAFVDRIQHASFADKVSLHLDDGPFAQRLAPERMLANVDKETHIYVCGPPGFMNWILHTARSNGWSEHQLHTEYFSNIPVAGENSLEAFEVELASTHQVFLVEAGQSITNVLRANGVYIPTSCEQGVCGTCLTNVIEGIPDHRDAFLTEDERKANQMMLPCCSRSKSPKLILDL